MNKVNIGKLEALLKEVANEQDLEICGINIHTNQNPTVIEIIIKKTFLICENCFKSIHINKFE